MSQRILSAIRKACRIAHNSLLCTITILAFITMVLLASALDSIEDIAMAGLIIVGCASWLFFFCYANRERELRRRRARQKVLKADRSQAGKRRKKAA